MAERVEVYKNKAGKFAWRKVAVNEEITATDGGQGYTRLIDAVRMAKRENEGLPIVEVYEDARDPEPMV